MPTVAPTLAAPATPTRQVTRLEILALIDDQELLTRQLADFESQYPEIRVAPIFVPWNDFSNAHAALLTQGRLDVVAFPQRPQVVEGAVRGELRPLDDWLKGAERADFFPAFLDGVTVEGRTYALPWTRDPGCLPYYTSLALVRRSKFGEAGYQLIDFLTQPKQQVVAFDLTKGKRTPTRRSVTGQLGLGCPEPKLVVDLAPQDGDRARGIAAERSAKLDGLLKDHSAQLSGAGVERNSQRLNVGAATAATKPTVSEYKTLEAALNAALQPHDFYVVLAPIYPAYTRDELQRALVSKAGVIVGAIFGVDAPLRIRTPEDKGEFIIQPGADYLVLWRAESGNWRDITYYLVTPDGTQTAVGKTRLSDEGKTSVNVPRVTVEIGSCQVCWYVDASWPTCEWISEAWLSFYMWWKNVSGAYISGYQCGP